MLNSEVNSLLTQLTIASEKMLHAKANDMTIYEAWIIMQAMQAIRASLRMLEQQLSDVL